MSEEHKITGIGDFVIDCYTEYGDYVNKSRHVPRFEDGLKPVYKRLILTALRYPEGEMVKTLALLGDLIKYYHPHSSDGAIGVVSELVRAGIFDGQGNFGDKGMFRWSDFGPAAPRYTEVRLNKKFRDLIGKLLPYVPQKLNDLDNMESEYIPIPYPICLQLGSFGMAVGLSTNTPAFKADSMIRAGYAAICKTHDRPWELLEPSYGLTMTNEDKELFWNKSEGRLTYNFSVNPANSGGLNGWYIEGDPSFVKPKTSKLFKAKGSEGKLVIRDESYGNCKRIFVARSKRIKTITDSEVEQLVYDAASVTKHFSLWTVYGDQSRRVTGGVWIKKCMLHYNELVKQYRADSISKIDFEISVFKNFKVVSRMILNTEFTYKQIAKEINVDEAIVKRISGMTIGSLRTTDPDKKIKNLEKDRKYFETLTTKKVLQEFL